MANEIPDILMFMCRVGSTHPEQMASLARTAQRSFNLYVEYTPTSITAFQAVNRLFKRSRSRWICLCDDDVVFLEDRWLDVLIGYLEKYDDLAEVTPMEIKMPEQLDMFKQDRSLVVPTSSPKLIETTWNAGYVSLFDREKMPDLVCEEGFAGTCGMSDVDLSLQCRHRGFRTAITTRTIVYHGFKPTDLAWRRKERVVTEEEGSELHRQHVQVMFDKWGAFYQENAQHRLIGTIE